MRSALQRCKSASNAFSFAEASEAGSLRACPELVGIHRSNQGRSFAALRMTGWTLFANLRLGMPGTVCASIGFCVRTWANVPIEDALDANLAISGMAVLMNGLLSCARHFRIRMSRSRQRPSEMAGVMHIEGSEAGVWEGPMGMIDGILQELEQEAETTRRVLERVPGSQLAWRPHEKARTLGQLALHVAIVPGGVAELIASPSPAQPPRSPIPARTARRSCSRRSSRALQRRNGRSAGWMTPRSWPSGE